MEIDRVELQSPFAYLIDLTDKNELGCEKVGGSNQFQLPTLLKNACAKMPNEDVGHFLSMVRFEQRARLAELTQNLLEIHS